MNSFRKFRVADAIKWVPFLCAESNFRAPKSDLYVNWSSRLQFVRFLATESALSSHNEVNLCELAKRSRVAKDEAQAVLLDYFHSTSGLQFSDAENMSKNSPKFFHSLTNMVVTDEDKVTRSLSRFLRYNPINEFEPFFESIGLKPSEYLCYLPRNLLFLNDDPLLLENYYFFCNYGIARNRIGKIYKEATEVFGLEPGALGLKLRSFEKLGLNQSLISKIIASSPHLLKGNIEEFVEVLERLKKLGIGYEWLGDHISADDSYNWKCMLELMCFLSDLGLSQDLQRELFIQHPTLLLEQSGRITFCLFGFFLKFGSTLDDVESAFLGLPKLPVLKFACNLHNSYQFLVEIGMAVEDIGKLVRLHPTILGSCEIRTVRSLGCLLSCGKNELCQMLKEDPLVFNNWAVEELEEKKCVEFVRARKTRDEKLKVKKSVEIVRARKTKFLMSLGFEENSKAMQKTLNVFRGNGAAELQERFDCLLNMGLNREDLIGMVKLSPQILNQPKDAIEKKIGVFVEELGYPVTDLLAHPRLISYTMERVKRRLLMYKWLREEGVVHPKLAPSTLLSCSEEVFVKNQVKSHPQGPQMYETLKIEIKASGEMTSEKAMWDRQSTKIFIEVCVTEFRQENRSGSHLSKTGWNNLVTNLNLATGHTYNKKQLKNRWDTMKKEYSIWKKLMRDETGVRWDVKRGTINMPPDWWTQKIKELPSVAKFRKRGPILLEDQQLLFDDTIATGENAWTPSQGVLPANMFDTDNDEEHEEFSAPHSFLGCTPDNIDGEPSVSKRKNHLPTMVRKKPKNRNTSQAIAVGITSMAETCKDIRE